MADKSILFKVLMGISGHKYVIYDNGETEGFGDGKESCLVFNHYPELLAAHELKLQEQMESHPIGRHQQQESPLRNA